MSRDIYCHQCVRCDKDLISDRVVVERGDISIENGRAIADETQPFLCEPCFEKERTSLYLALRQKKPIVDHPCDLCGQSRQSRYLKDLACHVCDTCQDDNDRSDEQIMSTMYTIEVQKTKFEVPDEIIPGKLYLGSKNSTTNDEFLVNGMNISQIIVCCGHLPQYFRDNQNLTPSIASSLSTEGSASPCQKYAIRYLRLPIRDNLEQDLRPYLESALEFINEGYNKYNTATLVHCHAGVSRSASVVIAWLMRNENMDYDTAHAFLKGKRKAISPNSNFVEQLRTFS
jgi:hypothetical protein